MGDVSRRRLDLPHELGVAVLNVLLGLRSLGGARLARLLARAYPNIHQVLIPTKHDCHGHHQEYDVALIFSQDQDLSEVAEEMREIAREQRRWIKVACAFPSSPTSRNRRGIEKTDWIRIDRATYDACLDRRDYRLGPQGDDKAKG